ncbi:mandelate racemase/muconate lactonizing enzyme family protein [Caldovatus aquaticus]|uniref:Mandelate racemase/muconate lactonizing enzyme family protein n=1 Tax=Caldovatus aquaticus TaxID=2865671 RepID=A0ABS7F460_9PROT|nr:mandelate racemase/muconate lactonizing enzyme family protein [Caldovatus aquaticus]
MRISRVATYIVRSPFRYGAPAGAGGNLHLRTLDTLLVRVETDAGVHGWGEGFGFTLADTTRTAIETLIGPACLGRDPRDIAGLTNELRRRLHNFGRNGPVTFGISAIDIALWDIAGRLAGQPLHRLLADGATTLPRVPAYASLLRYGDPALVERNAAEAYRRGYREVKLHEAEVPMVRAARAVLPAGVPITIDVNCRWDDPADAIAFARAVQGLGVRWLEEPVWPPEDYAGLARVRAEGGLAVAAGENAAQPEDFARMLAAGAVDYVQPSVTKVGGVSAMRAVAEIAARHGAILVPHSPYFGPGYLATLHLIAAWGGRADVRLETYFLDAELPVYGRALDPAPDGTIAVPQAPGLGLEPDPAVLARFAQD